MWEDSHSKRTIQLFRMQPFLLESRKLKCRFLDTQQPCFSVLTLKLVIFSHNLMPKSGIWSYFNDSGGGGIAQLLASLSTKRAVRVRFPLNPLVSERWNSITLLLTRSHQCWRLVKKKAVHVLLCLCNNACKRSLAICRKSRALCPVSRLLSVPRYLLNREGTLILFKQTNKS